MRNFVTIEVLRADKLTYSYDIQVSEAQANLLAQYATGELHLIKEIQEVQGVLSRCGYGISNTVLLSVSDVFNK